MDKYQVMTTCTAVLRRTYKITGEDEGDAKDRFEAGHKAQFLSQTVIKILDREKVASVEFSGEKYDIPQSPPDFCNDISTAPRDGRLIVLWFINVDDKVDYFTARYIERENAFVEVHAPCDVAMKLEPDDDFILGWQPHPPEKVDLRQNAIQNAIDALTSYLLDECPDDQNWEDFDPEIDSIRYQLQQLTW